MALLRAVKRYKRKLEKKFTKQKGRKQFNFACDTRLAGMVRGLAHYLEVPTYPICEHLFEVGLLELTYVITNTDQKQALQRHLLRQHLLVPKLDPLDHQTSHRLRRIQVVMSLFETLEKARGTEMAGQIVASIIKEAADAELKEEGIGSPRIGKD